MTEFIGCYTKRVITHYNAFSLADAEFIRRTCRTRWHFVVLLTTLLAGCVPQRDIAQPRHSQPAGEIWGTQTIGQTFVARHDGLRRIDVLLATYARENTGAVTFHLRESPAAEQDLATVQFDAAEVEDNAYRTFTFPPLLDSQGRSYYFFFEAPIAEPGNAITVWATPTDAYSGGRAFLAGQPQAGDLAFRTYAEYGLVQIGTDLWQGLRHRAGTALLAALLWLIPGASVLSLLGWKSRRRGNWRLGIEGWGTAITVSAGLSVAIAPLLILLASLISLRLSRGPVIALLSLFAVLTALPSLRQRLSSDTPSPQPSSPPAIQPTHAPTLLLPIIFLVSLTTRLLVVRDLPAPMWGDSYQHTLIAQLLVDHGKLFSSWEPYAPLKTFTYHFGFHSNVSLFYWLTGTPVLKSVIVVGQGLNALAPLMLYPLVRRLGGSAWAGAIAVLIASLLSPMPSRYVNWGRYTQLTGMVVLPLAATLLIDAVRAEDRGWGRLALAAIAVAGLFLSHYLVALLFVPLVLACLGWRSLGAAQHRSRVFSPQRNLPLRNQTGSAEHAAYQTHRKTRLLASAAAAPWLRASAAGLVAGVLLAPWLVNLWRGRLLRVLASRFGSGSQATYFQTTYNVVGDVQSYVPAWLIILALIGAGWGLWRRQSFPITVSIWSALLVLLANPYVLRLPGTGIVHNFMLLLSLYAPLSMLAGAGVAAAIQRITQRAHQLGKSQASITLVAGLITVAALVGARYRLVDLDNRYQLVTMADLEAMEWIRRHTPVDAKFLVNSFASFGGRTIVGDDAGWWIPYLAGRSATVPPATYGMEASYDPHYAARMLGFHEAVTRQPLDSPEAVQILQENDITHVYIGAVGGRLLDPVLLMHSSFYKPIYQQDGAMIFEFRGQRP